MLLHESLGDSLGHVSLVEDQPATLSLAQVDVQVEQGELSLFVLRDLPIALVSLLLLNSGTSPTSEVQLGPALAQGLPFQGFQYFPFRVL